jgi:hypothetical protein
VDVFIHSFIHFISRVIEKKIEFSEKVGRWGKWGKKRLCVQVGAFCNKIREIL